MFQGMAVEKNWGTSDWKEVEKKVIKEIFPNLLGQLVFLKKLET
ncbi:MAG TPA: hypothetical protein VGP47_08115 [Parachlamydiaceae bacterium]|nr:hypothetical protein [Parachlamydiaceae bacterium]